MCVFYISKSFLFQMNVNYSKSLTARHELLSLYNEHVMPKPQRRIFCKNSEKSKHSVSPVKDDNINRKRRSDSPTKEDRKRPTDSPTKEDRKRPTDSPIKEGEGLTRKKFKKITFP